MKKIDKRVSLTGDRSISSSDCAVAGVTVLGRWCMCVGDRRSGNCGRSQVNIHQEMLARQIFLSPAALVLDPHCPWLNRGVETLRILSTRKYDFYLPLRHGAGLRRRLINIKLQPSVKTEYLPIPYPFYQLDACLDQVSQPTPQVRY